MTQSAGQLPNLIIAGVRKGGTTSLSHYLFQHPDICSSALKKVGYFLPLKYGETPPPLETYAAHFADCATPYRMEATTGYFLGGAAIARPLVETLPGVKVIIVLREPVDALWSHYRFVRSHARIDADLSFEDYVDACRTKMASDADLARENNAFVAYRGGFYDQPLTEWADALGDSLRVLFFDDLKSDAPAVLRSLCRWLGIDGSPVDGFDFDVHNQSVQVKNLQVQRVALRTNERAKRLLRRHHGLKRRVRSAYYLLNRDRGPQPRLDPALRQELTGVYEPSNANCGQLLADRDLSGPMPAWLSDPR